jgi:outer membrane protein OmpA-like peptidoglycan-associated protein
MATNVRRKPAASLLLLRRWLIPGIALSAGLHFLLLRYSQTYSFRPFNDTRHERFIPKPMQVRPVEIDPRVLETKPEQPPTTDPRPPAVDLPRERPAAEDLKRDIIATPAAPGITQPVLLPAETPASAPLRDLSRRIEDAAKGGPGEKELARIPDALLETADPRPNRARMGFSSEGTEHGTAVKGSANRGVPAGFTDLDALLASGGALSGSEGPILMPADLLFDYDQALLRDNAMASLRKLGALMLRNPSARFRIEGHTDSFGADDYNLRLSQQRAESVRAWLAENLGIDPARIETRGLGKTRLLSPASGTVEEQQLNRRVEIVIRSAR